MDGSLPLVFMTGSLGDTLAAVPALWVLRRSWTDSPITLLSNREEGCGRVGPSEILEGSGLADRFTTYRSQEGPGRPLTKWMGRWELALFLHRFRPDPLIYLIRGDRDQSRVGRDLAFFRWCGVRRIVGVIGMPGRPPSRPGVPPRLPRQADQYLVRLAAAGFLVPPPGKGRADIALGPQDFARMEQWRLRLADDRGRPWIAIGPGSKMPAKRWEEARFAELGRRLIATYNAQPVIFGGPEEKPLALRLMAQWGRGHLAAGTLDVRASAAALSRCRLYVGNDTGTMHLAAAAGILCVAIFSARGNPGLWEPYGDGHLILRHDPPCAGCMQITCPVPGHPCLSAISVDEVFEACRRVLF
jgi:heptosyltransferase-3